MLCYVTAYYICFILYYYTMYSIRSYVYIHSFILVFSSLLASYKSSPSAQSYEMRLAPIQQIHVVHLFVDNTNVRRLIVYLKIY